MGYDAIFSGPPSIGAPGDAVSSGIDTGNFTEYVSVGNGWVPVSASAARGFALGQTANVTNVLTYTAPVNGLYLVTAYEVSTVATSGTLPAVNAAFTDADTTGSITAVVVASKSSSAANVINTGSVVVNAEAGTTIVVSTASYASLTFNIKARISYLG